MLKTKFKQWFSRDYIALHIPTGYYLCPKISIVWPSRAEYIILDSDDREVFTVCGSA
jgi:hypothetical protein